MARIFRRRGNDGKWLKAWYAWILNPETNKLRKVSTKVTSQADAQRRADELQAAALDPDSASQAKATLGDAFELLIADRTSLAKGGKRSMSTVEFYEKKAGILLGAVPEALGLEEGAAVKLKSVTASLVDDYIMMRRDDGVTESTIQKELTTWRAAMRLAKRRRWWRGDLEEVFPKFGDGYKPRDRFLQPHEVIPLRDAFIRPRKYRGGSEGDEHGHALWAIAAFMIGTSAEWSAVWRARRDDFDLADPNAWFVRVRGSKRETRDRVVPIVHLPFALLLDDVLRYADGENGLFLNRESSFRHRLAEACERAGIAHLSPNDLRRTHGRWLRLAGVHTTTFYPSLGHADNRMSERVYAKTSARELADVMRAELALKSGLLMGSASGETGQTRALPSAAKPEKDE